jgi:TonB family protein
MYLFLKKNLRVPENLKVAGTVVVSFVVDEKGAIKEAVVEQGLTKACDAEALRVVKMMPKWNPCQAEGKPVRSRIEVPLTFSPVKVKSSSSDSELVPVPEQPVKIPRQLRNGGG